MESNDQIMNQTLMIKLTLDQKNALRENAKKTGLTLAGFARYSIIKNIKLEESV